MTSRLMDHLREWNPQFVRELKGRLIAGKVTLAVRVSLGVQLVIFIAFISQLPGPEDLHNHYCLYQKSSLCTVDWMQWWEDLNQVFYWILPLALVSGGVYLLIADLAKEERRGTLNLIRLSPQSSQHILIGKLLGVPVLLYLAVAIALPAYVATAMMAHISLWEVWIFYVFLAALCGIFYSAATLFALRGGHQALVGAGITLSMLWWLRDQSGYSIIDLNFLRPYYCDWVCTPGARLQFTFGLLFQEDIFFAGWIFILVNCAFLAYWIWQGVYRQFHNPTATILSKKQSYLLVFYWNCFFLICCINVFPFGFTNLALDAPEPVYLWFERLDFIAMPNLFLFLGLIAALSPPRQTLLDWAGYAHKARPQAVFQDLIWGEKSPLPVAIAICATITALIFIPWVLLWPVEMVYKLQVITAIGFYAILVSIYAVLAQIMLLIKSKKGALWATGVVAAAIGLPLFILTLSGEHPRTIPDLYLLSIDFFRGLEYASATPIFIAFLGHLAILAALSLRLRQQLNRAGESATQALLLGRNVS
ncbi:hypothetical protein NG796_08190 [Laspinema sp. A4]|uniref:hypothetical protein n=1 Tax=Laspinema sp. D2d TaxID=2953686 RepID=UPI0021BA96E0|nr:hypothetical protein [Laspinema sp. D2d]MCT7983270.1 hypothetical protein [Laspinema sp. D2d]